MRHTFVAFFSKSWSNFNLNANLKIWSFDQRVEPLGSKIFTKFQSTNLNIQVLTTRKGNPPSRSSSLKKDHSFP
jgi:hypothetical protein